MVSSEAVDLYLGAGGAETHVGERVSGARLPVEVQVVHPVGSAGTRLDVHTHSKLI